ncbi:MAG: hypothetical protein ABI870_08315 [Rhodanobacter sp.]
MILSTFIAGRTAGAGWLVLAGPLLLGLALLGADALQGQLRGKPARPAPAAWLLAGTCLLAGLLVMLRDPDRVQAFIPGIGTAAWVTLLRPGSRKGCGGRQAEDETSTAAGNIPGWP